MKGSIASGNRLAFRRRTLLQASAAIALPTVLPEFASAQEAFPDKPVRLVVSYGPGGAIDVVARILAEHMTTTLGKPVLVENKPGRRLDHRGRPDRAVCARRLHPARDRDGAFGHVGTVPADHLRSGPLVPADQPSSASCRSCWR
jgi:hypothetical protein